MINAYLKNVQWNNLSVYKPSILPWIRRDRKQNTNRGGFERAVTQRGGADEDKTKLDSRGSRAERALAWKDVCGQTRK